MDISTAHKVYQALQGRDFAFVYSGVFVDDHTASIMAIGQEALDAQADRALRSRLSFVLVEAFQNIIRHRAGDHERSILMMQRTGDGCLVTSVNPVGLAEGAMLEERLHAIHGLDRSQLKSLFLQRLQNTTTSSRGGAGLGVIEMARRSGRTPEHHLWPAGDGSQLFALHVRLGATAPEVNEEMIRWLHGTVARENVHVLVKGTGGPGLQQALLGLSASVSRAGGEERAQRIFLSILEFVSTHGNGDPLLVWTVEPAGHMLTIGMQRPLNAASELAAEVARVQGMDQMQLKQHYRDQLIGRHEGGVGVGLLDLARHARGRIGFQVQQEGAEVFSTVHVPL